jgi:hypothetical protein
MRLALAALALLAAPGCSSEPTADERFIDRLVEAGVLAEDASESERADLIAEGRAWCENLESGEVDRADVERALASSLAEVSDMRRAQVGVTLGTAVQTYCPEAGDRVQ